MFQKERYRIEPFRHRVDLEPDYKEKTWKVLESAIQEIFDHNPSKLSFEELYRSAYNLVLHKFGPFLYESFTQTVSGHLDVVGKRIEKRDGDAFLEELVSSWRDYTRAMHNIRDILMYMNKTFVRQHNKTPVHELGLELWNRCLLQRPLIRNALQTVVLETLARHRRQSAAALKMQEGGSGPLARHNAQVALVSDMVISLGNGVYEELIEAPLEADTERFYRLESQDAILACDCPSYLALVDKRLGEEGALIEAYHFGASKRKILQRVEHEMLEMQVDALIGMKGSGLLHQLTSRDYAHMSLMYRLMQRTDRGHAAMVDVIKAHVVETGQRIMRHASEQARLHALRPKSAKADTAQGDPKPSQGKEGKEGKGGMEMGEGREGDAGKGPAVTAASAAASGPAQRAVRLVHELMDERAMCDAMLRESFDGDKRFVHAIQSCFERVLNDDPGTPEHLSLFLDTYLRRDLKGKTEEEAERMIDRVMTLFRYLHEKDVFERYYKGHLAKRLLNGRLSSEDQEQVVISKLKTECGYQFTSKLESMFNDIRTSQDTMQRFRQSSEAEQGGLHATPFAHGIDLSVQVLTTGSWPTQQHAVCQIPQELQDCCAQFERFYLKTHSGRKLAWQTNMGHGEIRAVFGRGEGQLGGAPRRHELCVSTVQMCVLMLFSSQDTSRLSYGDIMQATQIPEPELKRTLQSLACVKGKNVLTKSPPGREIGAGDCFSYNESFRSKLYRVKIGTIAAAAGGAGTSGGIGGAGDVGGRGAEDADVRKVVEEDRKPQVEAAIVRVMKSRRTMNHNAVVSEVTQLLSQRFMPSPAMIKQRVESLIDREFLERDEADRRTYRYVA